MGVVRLGVRSGGKKKGVPKQRATRLHLRRQPARAIASDSTELVWLREQVEQSHHILDSYGVPRTTTGHGSNDRQLTLTLAGRLRSALGDPTRKARHAAPLRSEMIS